MSTATQQTQKPSHGHVKDEGIAKAMGIGKGNKRLNTNAHDLQAEIEKFHDDFLERVSHYVGGVRHDYMREGLLGEIIKTTPILVYDLPELKRFCDTAFVDKSGKMYISDTFARRLLEEHRAGMDSLNFLVRHEGDHIRRAHLTRLLEFPRDISYIATDTRINLDLHRAGAIAAFSKRSSRDPSAQEMEDAMKTYITEMSAGALGCGVAMKYEDWLKWGTKSETTIAAELMKDWVANPTVQNREVSFEHIMEGAAQEAEAVKVMLQSGVKLAVTPPPNNMTPAELSSLANDLRKVGRAKANPKYVTDAELQSCLDRLENLREHQGLLESDVIHTRASLAHAGKGTTHSSACTGDTYLDALRPSERVDLGMNSLKSILSPDNSSLPGEPQKGGLTIKDIERSMGRGGQPDKSSASRGDPNTIPMPNVYNEGDAHVADTAELAKTLTDAGVNEKTMKALGIDDLDKLEEEIKTAKDNIVSAINQASEDQMALGSRYPGGHLLNYAKAQLLDFFKPVLSWEMTFKKLCESLGRGQRFDIMEPWDIYSVDAKDMGFDSQRDVPYMGRMVPGKLVKPLVIAIHDTSGSVDDALLKRQISEGVNIPRRMSRGTSPDVLQVFADTVARGDPVFVTEKNYKKVLANGLVYGGRGGTAIQASIQDTMRLTQPVKGVKRTEITGRPIDAIVYFTDAGDAPPNPAELLKTARECGMKRLPPVIFVVPKFCRDEAFDAGCKGWATIVYYDASPTSKVKQHVNIDKAGRSQDAKMDALERAGALRMK